MPRHSLQIQIDTQPIINARDLKLAIQRCLIVTSAEKARYAFNVVRFRSDGAILELAASDGCRATSTRIEIDLPAFEILVSTSDCKTLKRMCQGKWDTVAISLGFPNRLGLTFSISTGESVTIGNDLDTPHKLFPPVERVLETEPNGVIPICDPEGFRRAVALALAAKRCGGRIPKGAPNKNLIHLTCTSRRITVFGSGNGIRAYSHLESDDRATPTSLMLNGSFFLDLIKFAPRAVPYELHQWGQGTKGLAFVSPWYRHYLSGMRYE